MSYINAHSVWDEPVKLKAHVLMLIMRCGAVELERLVDNDVPWRWSDLHF